MKKKYKNITALNRAWNTEFQFFEEVRFPRELLNEKFKPSPTAFSTAQDKRRWLDFIRWYHQAIIDFAGQSAKAAMKYFPASKVRMKPGGSSGSINPLTYGTYCPAYAKMAGKYHGLLQPADCQGAVFADKWMGTAYQFYGVKECTEPASSLDEKTFTRRIFSDASSGAAQLFTYEFTAHAAAIQKYVHLFTGKPGDTEIAVYCPTTFYQLGGNVQPTIDACNPLRDLCEFDVLDELLIEDGALTTKRYKALIVFQTEIVDQPILEKFTKFLHAGGKILVVGDAKFENVEGAAWRGRSNTIAIPAVNKDRVWLRQLSPELAGLKGYDGNLDGVWTCRRGAEVFALNTNNKEVTVNLEGKEVRIEPYKIWCR